MIRIRDIEIGIGKPKICVPITGRTVEEILEQARKISPINVDIVEWRVDYTEFASDKEKVVQVLEKLRQLLQNKLLLFTFRTKKEGGERAISEEEYFGLNTFVAKTALVDLVDIELYSCESQLNDYIEALHKTGCKVILSNHDFLKTPDEGVILARLRQMEHAGADIVKIAVMPQSPADVVTLLSATCKANAQLTKPVVTMSMAKLGAVSRITGQVFGSAITFGTVGEASAPGQIPVEQLSEFLDFFS